MSAPTLDEQIRAHLETLEAAPGDTHAFEALEALYEGASRWEDLVALYEGRAQATHAPEAPLLAKAASLAHTKLRNVARAEELYRQILRADPANRAALGALAERQTLRREFLAKGTASDLLARRLRQAELRFDAMVAQEALELATQRLAIAQRQQAAGAVDRIAVLRAELEMRERERDLQLLARELQQIGRVGAP